MFVIKTGGWDFPPLLLSVLMWRTRVTVEWKCSWILFAALLSFPKSWILHIFYLTSCFPLKSGATGHRFLFIYFFLERTTVTMETNSIHQKETANAYLFLFKIKLVSHIQGSSLVALQTRQGTKLQVVSSKILPFKVSAVPTVPSHKTLPKYNCIPQNVMTIDRDGPKFRKWL